MVCEWAMYGNNRTWANDSVGVIQPDSSWSMAEGCTAAGFETRILVQNPGGNSVEIDMYFMTDTEIVTGPLETIPPHSRRYHNAREYVDSYNVSTLIFSDGGDVICERAMYGDDRT
ncbi:MAG: hypothetical protein SWK76_06665 [Actinomycetota bacterium]|nr:hypothetical protein [Actinomycetota bacterium]